MRIEARIALAVVVVLLCVLWQYSSNRRHEQAAIAAIKSIAKAQTLCLAARDSYAPNLDELTRQKPGQTPLLAATWKDHAPGFRFDCAGTKPAPQEPSSGFFQHDRYESYECYEAWAVPEKPGWLGPRAFFIDCSGVIRVNAKGAAPSASDPPLPR